MQYPRKIYCIDDGIANIVGFKISENIGNIFENTVANELFRRGAKVYYWKNRQQEEVDFVVTHGAQVNQLIQVCYELETMDAKQREVKSLTKAIDAFQLKEGLIVTDTFEGREHIDGKNIVYLPLWKWLLE